MARKSLDASVKTHRENAEKQNNERFDKLYTETAGTFADILDDVFPHTDDDQPDWKKFNWDRATQLKTALQQFKDGHTIVPARSSEPRADQPSVTPPPSDRQEGEQRNGRQQQRRETRETRDTGDGEAVTVVRPARTGRPATAERTAVAPPASTPRKSVRQRMNDRLNS